MAAYKLFQDGYSPDEALEISEAKVMEANEKIDRERFERNKAVQIDIYYNTLCRINEMLQKEIDPKVTVAKVSRIVNDSITGMNVVGYTNNVGGGL